MWYFRKFALMRQNFPSNCFLKNWLTLSTKMDVFQLKHGCMIFISSHKMFFRHASRSWFQKVFVFTCHFWEIMGWFWPTWDANNFLSGRSWAEVSTDLKSLIPYVNHLLKPFLRIFAPNIDFLKFWKIGTRKNCSSWRFVFVIVFDRPAFTLSSVSVI